MFIEEWHYQRLLRELQEHWVDDVWEWYEEYCQRPAYQIPILNIPFFKVEAPTFTRTDVELRAYSMPITKIIEERSMKDIQTAVDNQLLMTMTWNGR